MQTEHAERLADMRMQWEMWSALTDTSQWDATFFFKILEQKDHELAGLRQELKGKTGEGI